jgi:hypothetical protein
LTRIHSGSFRVSSVSVVVRKRLAVPSESTEQDQRKQQRVDRLGDVDARARFRLQAARREEVAVGLDGPQHAEHENPAACSAKTSATTGGQVADPEERSNHCARRCQSKAESGGGPRNPAAEMRGTAYGAPIRARRSGGEDIDGDKMKNKEYTKKLRKLQAELCRCRSGSSTRATRHHRVRGPRHGRARAGRSARSPSASARACSGWWRCRRPPIARRRRCTCSATSRTFPAAGEIVVFDRSWYNRAGIEHVMGFCSKDEYESF